MNLEQQIEFHKIKERWIDLAVTDGAKEKIRELEIYRKESELQKAQRDTSNSRNLIEQLGTPPFQNLTELKEALEAAEKGDCLTPYQLERAEKALTAVRRLKDYLERGKAFFNPLTYYEENLDGMEELREEIGRQIRSGEVDDYATRELSRIRGQMAKCEEEMKQKAEQVINSRKDCMTDHYCTRKNGRICVPVKKECKLKIPGSVIEKSATGNTLFIEPAKVARQYEELQLLKIEEENEVYRILYTLSAMIAAGASALKENIAVIEKLDFLFSKGKLSMDLDAVPPTVNTERRIRLEGARHPLMEQAVCVPLQFEIGEGIRGIVITGPNTGGKTVAIKTVMLNCMMAQCGLHVTCKSADICMNNAYFCDIGDGQNPAENLSTFSSHITNVLEILREINDESFVIMDELGSGTDPAEGMGIAVAILEELKKSGALFLVTTHYPEVKEYARSTPRIQNARMLFDKKTLQPTYQMVIGEAGESCAFEIAGRLGMPKEMLRTAARAAYGEERAKALYGGKAAEPIFDRPKHLPRISKISEGKKKPGHAADYRRGDSVMVYPDRKIGIVCEPVNEKGVLRVQMPGKKIWINHKRVKLHVAAAQLYPEDYDFSILFETVENRKIRHDMERKYTEEVIRYSKEEGF